MANSPSEKWENGVLKERAIETNRWKVKPDGSSVDDAAADEKAAPDEKAEKAVKPARAENKGVKQGWRK